MFMIQITTVFLLAPLVWTLVTVQSKFFSNELDELLRHFSEQASVLAYEGSQYKREAFSDDNKVSSIFGPVLLSRADHYWTRKRGREGYTTLEPYFDTSRWVNPGLSPVANSITKKSLRRKRETVTKFQEMKNIIARLKRDIREEKETSAKLTTQQDLEALSGVAAIPLQPEVEVSTKASLQAHEESSKQKKALKRLRKFSQTNKCCIEESEFPEFNEILLAVKAQCLVETRKSRKNDNSSDDTIDGDAGLFNMFSCDRMNRWKTVVTCTLDCIAQKLGMIDSHGVLNINIAKQIVSDNFATQQWERDASDDLVEKCAKEISISTSKPVGAFGYQCSSKTGEFVYCMWRELFLGCPADKQVNSKQCDKLRSVLGKSNDNKFRN